MTASARLPSPATTWRAAALVAVTVCSGCVSVHVAQPTRGADRGAGIARLRAPVVLAFHCSGAAAAQCDALGDVASGMVRDAFPRAAKADAVEMLEISVAEHGDPLPQPLPFVRVVARLVTVLAAPVTVPLEDDWTLEVSVTSTAMSATRRYETAAYLDGGLFSPISIPPLPESAKAMGAVSGAINFPGRERVVRALVAAFLVDAAPEVCAVAEAGSDSTGAVGSSPNGEALRIACTLRGGRRP